MIIEKLENDRFEVTIKGVEIILTELELINLGKGINDMTSDWHNWENLSLDNIVKVVRDGKGFKMRKFSE